MTEERSLAFPPEEYAERLAAVRAVMLRRDVDVLVAVDPDGDLRCNCWQASHVIPSGSVVGKEGSHSETADSTATGPDGRLL